MPRSTPPNQMGSSPLLRMNTLFCHALMFFDSAKFFNLVISPFGSVWVSPTPSRSTCMHYGPCPFCVVPSFLFLMVFRPPPLHHLFRRCCIIEVVQLLRLFLLARIYWKTASFCCVFSAFVQRYSTSSQYSVWEFWTALPICTSSFPSSNCLITSDSSNSIGERTSFPLLSMTPSRLPIPWQFSRSSRVGKVSVLLVCART